MNIQYIPVDQVDPNPWQVRLEEDPQHIAVLAESMRENQTRGEHGMLQIPLARRSNGRVQLAFGMSRFAGWKEANPGDPFPVNLEELSDRQMSDLAAEENAKRKNLSAIEIATAIARRKKEFGLTDVEAGAPFGYHNQATISNLVRLLELPDEIQMQVHSGAMAERVARRLVPVARLAPDQVVKLARKALKEPDLGEREEMIVEEFDGLLDKRGKELRGVAWDLAWKPMSAENLSLLQQIRKPDDPAEIPACHRCEFYVKANYNQYCTRPACYELKGRLWSLIEARRISEEKKLALGSGAVKEWAQGSKVIAPPGADYRYAEQAKVALKTKHPSLFVYPGDGTRPSYIMKQLLGSDVVGLATIDDEALAKAIARLPKNDQPRVSRTPPQVGESSASAKVRVDRDAREARSGSRNAAETWRLEQAVAPHLVKALSSNAKLHWLIIRNCNDFRIIDDTDDEKGFMRLPSRARAAMVMLWLVTEAVDAGLHYIEHSDPGKARRLILDMAAHLKCRLPKGWDGRDRVDYPKDPSNCWNCGAQPYSEHTKIAESETEKERGWTVQMDGKKLAGILCPECTPKAKETKRRKAKGKAK